MVTLARLARRRFAPFGVGLLVLILLVVWAIGHAGIGDTAGAPAVVTATTGARADRHRLGTVGYAGLPAAAHHTLALIAAGGPFRYEHDGIVYQNREGVLPPEPRGYYHEYTVGTTGSADRGARRIIEARDGTLYYTDDHYRTFRRIVR